MSLWKMGLDFLIIFVSPAPICCLNDYLKGGFTTVGRIQGYMYGKYNKMLIVDSKWWVDRCSLPNSFVCSVCMKFFTIKC